MQKKNCNYVIMLAFDTETLKTVKYSIKAVRLKSNNCNNIEQSFIVIRMVKNVDRMQVILNTI